MMVEGPLPLSSLILGSFVGRKVNHAVTIHVQQVDCLGVVFWFTRESIT